MNVSRLLAIAAASAALALVGCEEKVSSANYTRITAGMTLSDVEHILGKGTKQEATGISISAAGIAGGAKGSSNQSTYVWQTRSGKGEISVVFQDGKAISFSQTGL